LSPTRLLIGLAFTRWRNRLGRTPRGAAARARWSIVGPLVFLLLTLATTHQLGAIAGRFEGAAAEQSAAAPGDEPALPPREASRRVQTLLLALWFLGALLTEFSNAGLETAAWDLEWLATQPVTIGQLARARIVARTLVSPFGWMWLGPLGVAIAWNADLPRWLAPIAGLLAIQPLLLLSAVVLTFGEIALHVVLRPGAVRNVKALASLGAGIVLFGTLQAARLEPHLPTIGGASAALLDLSPFGLLTRALAPPEGSSRAVAIGLLAAEALAAAAAGIALVARLVRSGVVVGGARVAARVAAPDAPADRAAGRPLTSPLLRRELTMLRRDVNYLMQTLLLPVALTLFQLGLSLRVEWLERSVPMLCAFGFGIAAYTYLQSALRTLAIERESLWVLYTFPRPLSELMVVKARLYAGVGLSFAAIFLAVGASAFAHMRWRDLAPLGLLLLGTPAFAFALTALGALSTRRLERDAPRHAPAGVIYAAMALIAIFATAIATAEPWRAFGILVLMMLLAMGLWQRACDRLPGLLDPDAAIPRRLTIADGIAALLLFTVLQAVISWPAAFSHESVRGRTLFTSYAAAALASCGLVELWLRRRAIAVLPLVGAWRAGRSLRFGVALGAACGLAGIGWQAIARRAGWIDLERLLDAGPDPGAGWIAAVALVIAPPCEELLFRRLAFEGLRRSFGVGRAALASALLFAILHPMLSFPPVLLLGLATAWACARTGGMLAPIAAHMVYNLCVVVGAAAAMT